LNKTGKILFEQLKKEIAKTYLRNHTASSTDIRQWKGGDITGFQEDLLHTVKGRVSEKWFYTYIKNQPEKLPRIDMLNLLSQYAGYQNWADFKNKHSQTKKVKRLMPYKVKWLIGGFVSLILVSFFISRQTKQTKQVRFCFNQRSFVGENLQVFWILPGESAKKLPVNKHCVYFQTTQDTVLLQIKSPYYIDTLIKRHVRQDYTEQIHLQPDLISLLLRHYARSETNQWEKRLKWLQQIISDKAMIFQQLSGQNGVELYDKVDFINQLCQSPGWFKQIEIIEISYQNNQVTQLRFRLKPGTNSMNSFKSQMTR